MSELLTLHRSYTDARTASSRAVFSHDPFVVDLNNKIVTPERVVVSVEDTSDEFRGEGCIKDVTYILGFDEYGRPVTEYIDDQVEGVKTITQTLYTGGLDYECTRRVAGTDPPVEDRFGSTWIDEDNQIFDILGYTLSIGRVSVGDQVVITTSLEGKQLERSIYSSDGLLQKNLRRNIHNYFSPTKYFYNETGQLIRTETNPGSQKFEGRKKVPDVMEFEYHEGLVRILGTFGKGIPDLIETRVYDEADRPTEIAKTEHPVPFAQIDTTIEANYPEELTLMERFRLQQESDNS